MKFTLSDCVSRINQVLNYPAVAYEDISHFFDQAIAELNTNLRIALPSVTEMRSEHTFEVSEQEGLVRLTTRPTSATTLKHYLQFTDMPSDGTVQYAYVCGDTFNTRKFYKYIGGTDGWKEVSALYGILVDDMGDVSTYVAVPISTTVAVWTPVSAQHISEFDLTDYLPLDWWTLFIIPYVCFKFAVRNGDSGELFSDEFTQGYQQLQSSYNVPNTVKLREVAGKPAYAELVKLHLEYIGNGIVFTRAIYEDMRVGNGIASVYGGIYESGGWGI